MNDLIFRNFERMGFKPSARNQIIIDLTFKELQHDYSGLIKFLNPSNQPMVNTHFYAWLENGGYADNIIVCRRKYLEHFGFVQGRDYVDQDALNTLKYILETFWLFEIDSKLPR